MAKVFYTYQQQLDKLEKEKDLIIQDRNYAENKLKEISYYSLIGGYKQPFKHLPSGKYLRGVTFEEIVRLKRGLRICDTLSLHLEGYYLVILCVCQLYF